MHDRTGLLPEWVVAELRRPIHGSDALHQKVMAGVRTAARPSGVAPMVIRARTSVAQPTRGFRASGAVAAIAASVVCAIATSTLVRSRAMPPTMARGAAPGHVIVLGDTVDSALHDTLRLVRFVLRAPAAARVAIAGDFNGWSRTATPLTDSAGSGIWSAVVALDRGSGRYAFVVDDTRWVAAAPLMTGAGSAPLGSAPAGGDST